MSNNVKEIDKICNNVKIINKMKINKASGFNVMVIDVPAHYDVLDLYAYLKKEMKVGIIPISASNVKKLETMNIPYIDVYEVFPGMKIEMNGYDFFDPKLVEEVKYEELRKYDVIIIYDIVNMSPLLREFIALYFKKYLYKTALINVYDSSAYVPSDRELFRMDIRVHNVLSKDLSISRDTSSLLTYMMMKIRSGRYDKLCVRNHNTDSYKFQSVVGKDFKRRFSTQELLSYESNVTNLPQFFCSNMELGEFTRRKREELGYTKITPQPGEILVAYNTFKTNSGVDDIIVRKGTFMTFNRLLDSNVMSVDINGKEYVIVFDKNVFKNVLQSDIMGNTRMILEEEPPLMAHVFYAYVLASRS